MIHKMVHNILNIKAAVTYVPYQDLENKILMNGLLDTPEEFLNHLRRFSYSLATQMIFGFRCPDIQDPQLQQLFWVRMLSFCRSLLPIRHQRCIHILTHSVRLEFRPLGRIGRER